MHERFIDRLVTQALSQVTSRILKEVLNLFELDTMIKTAENALGDSFMKRVIDE